MATGAGRKTWLYFTDDEKQSEKDDPKSVLRSSQAALLSKVHRVNTRCDNTVTAYFI